MSTVVASPKRFSASVNHRHRPKRFVILASAFNDSITRPLATGASETLQRAGVAIRHIQVLWVPGAFELPVIAARVAQGRNAPTAIIAVGALIRGQTSQYQVLAHAVAEGLAQVSVKTGVPVTFGIIVAETVAQARARAGGAMGNRGTEAALAALATLRLLDTMAV